MNAASEAHAHEAIANYKKLCHNAYPGRGIVIGLNNKGLLVQVYWIGGRSSNSQNRVFSCANGRVWTEAADPSKVEDPSLILYNAMVERYRTAESTSFVVSNGHQTDALASAYPGIEGLRIATQKWQYEPDSPNFTPRISGLCEVDSGKAVAALSALRKMPQSDECERSLYPLFLEKGIGYCITTYAGDGDPLPTYQDEPYPVPLHGSIDEVATAYWSALDQKTRVSLVVKGIDIDTKKSTVTVINRFKKKMD